MAVIAFLVINLIAISYRWYVSISFSGAGYHLSFGNVIYYQYISMFASLLFPAQLASTIGRVGLLELNHIPIIRGSSSVLVDRISVTGSWVILSIISLCMMLVVVPLQHYDTLLLTALLVVLISVVVSFFYVPYMVLYILHKIISRKYRFTLLRTAVAVSRLFKNPKLFLSTFISSFISMFTSIMIIWLLILTRDVPLSFVMVSLVIPAVMLVSSLPFSYNGWGVRELSIVYMFGMLGVDKESAIIISVQYGIIHTVFCLIGGLAAFRLIFNK